MLNMRKGKDLSHEKYMRMREKERKREHSSSTLLQQEVVQWFNQATDTARERKTEIAQS
jgi:hypothetical protein